ncbi:hypothetical protein EPN18_05075 [bacterium]|nr:MAG: hypothetical protein EPN18_05075 [bacterium]
MSSAKSIFKNSVLVLFAKVANAIFAFLTTIVVARYLGIEEYGNYIFIITVVTFIIMFADFGNFQILVRELSKSKDNMAGIVGTVFLLRFIVSAALLSIIFFIINYSNIDPLAKKCIYLVIIPTLFFALNTIFVAVFTAHNRFGFDALMQILSKAGEFFAIIFIVIFKFGFVALFGGIAIVYMLNGFIGLFIYLKNYGVPVIKYDLDFWKFIIAESLPLIMVTFFTIGMVRVDIFVLQYFKDAKEIALFNTAHTFIYTLMIIPQSFVSVMYPVLCRLGERDNDRSVFAFGYKKAFKILYIVSLPLSIILINQSDKIMQIVFGPKFSASAVALKLMGLAVIFLFLGFLNSFSLVSLRKQKLILASTVAAFLLNFAFDLLLIPKYGYIGASIASGIGYFAFFAFSFYFVRKNLGQLNLSHTIIRPFLGAICMIAFLTYFHNASLFIVIPFSVTIYALGLVASGVFLDEDVKLMKSVIFR